MTKTPPSPQLRSVVWDFGDSPVMPTGIEISPGGKLTLLQDGRPLIADRQVHTVSRYRTNGREKIMSQVPLEEARMPPSELAPLADFDFFFAVDTNCRFVAGHPTAVSSVVVGAVVRTNENSAFMFFHPTHSYAFLGLPQTLHERLGWFLVQDSILSSPDYRVDHRYAIITDSGLSDHSAINAGQAPLFGMTTLASNIRLLYATSDSGPSDLKDIVRKCDRMSNDVLRSIERGDVPSPGRYPIHDAPCSHILQLRTVRPPPEAYGRAGEPESEPLPWFRPNLDWPGGWRAKQNM
jgi:hypothetical protein